MKQSIILGISIVGLSYGMSQELETLTERYEMLRQAGVNEEELAPLRQRANALREELQKQQTSAPSDFDFEEQLADLEQLKDNALVLERAGKDSASAMGKHSLKSYQLLENLREQSKNKWFYTGDLLWKVLRVKEVPMRHVTPYGETIIVPDELLAQLQNPFIQLVSSQQIYNTCGFNTLANAYAIEEQVRQRRQITDEQTRRLAEAVFERLIEKHPLFKNLVCPQIGFREAEYNDLLEMLPILGLRSSFVPDPNFFIIDTTNIADESALGIQARAVRSNTATHFVYRTPAHFLLISVLRNNGLYTMIGLDSANAVVEPKSERAGIVRYIDRIIMRARQEVPRAQRIEPAPMPVRRRIMPQQPDVVSQERGAPIMQEQAALPAQPATEQPLWIVRLWYWLWSWITWMFGY